MEKNDWNWKNTLLSSVVGFFVGRITAPMSDYPSSSSLQQDVSQLSEESLQQEKEAAMQAVLLLLGVVKEGAKDMGYELPADEIASSKADEIIERAIARTNEKAGRPPEHVLNIARSIGRSIISVTTKLISSGVPAVPAYASPQTFNVVFETIERVLRERIPESILKDPNLIPQMESLLRSVFSCEYGRASERI